MVGVVHYKHGSQQKKGGCVSAVALVYKCAHLDSDKDGDGDEIMSFFIRNIFSLNLFVNFEVILYASRMSSYTFEIQKKNANSANRKFQDVLLQIC